MTKDQLANLTVATALDTYADLFDDDLESVAAALDAARTKALRGPDAP